MVAEFMIRDGWGVSVGAPVEERELLNLVRDEWFDAIGFSVACDSRLWQLRSVLLTPHVSAVSPTGFWTRELALFLDNWHRYVSRQPLRNVVDKAEGY